MILNREFDYFWERAKNLPYTGKKYIESVYVSMQISNNYNQYISSINNLKNDNKPKFIREADSLSFQNKTFSPTFKASPITAINDYLKFKRAQQLVKAVAREVQSRSNGKDFLFRNLSMEAIEGLQYRIDVFKGLSMKDIQYLSENLHVIAVKRGCNNMCGYCYADAKPSNREMSWEDFTSITQGFKKLRKRIFQLPLFGENMHKDEDSLIYKTTELFYDSDCMTISLKDKHKKLHDFRELVTELYDGTGRKSAFDTSGWIPENTAMQKRAEEYVEYFSNPENMDKLNQFNLSFNVFSATNIASVKAYRAGDKDRGLRLQEKFTDKIANAIFTFTPLLKSKKFNIMQRAFGFEAVNAEGFDPPAMFTLIEKVVKKVKQLFEQDLNGVQKYVKSEADIKQNMALITEKMERIDTALNSSGRMLEFMKSFGIKAPMQEHTESTRIMYEDLKNNGRYHRFIAHKLIDTDGRVYHMDYARFFPTEIQLNLKNRSASPRLANLKESCPITNEMINRQETRYSLDHFI